MSTQERWVASGAGQIPREQIQASISGIGGEQEIPAGATVAISTEQTSSLLIRNEGVAPVFIGDKSVLGSGFQLHVGESVTIPPNHTVYASVRSIANVASGFLSMLLL